MRTERCSLGLAMEVIGDIDLSHDRSPELYQWRIGDKNLIEWTKERMKSL